MFLKLDWRTGSIRFESRLGSVNAVEYFVGGFNNLKDLF